MDMNVIANLLPYVVVLFLATEAPLRVTVRPEQVGAPSGPLRVVARPVSFSGPEQVQVLDPASGSLSVTFSLKAGSLYELALQADGWWSRAPVVRAGEEREVVLPIWPLRPRVFAVSGAPVGLKAEAWFSSDGELSPRSPRATTWPAAGRRRRWSAPCPASCRTCASRCRASRRLISSTSATRRPVHWP